MQLPANRKWQAFWEHPQHWGRLLWPRLAGKRMVTAWLGKPVLSRLYLNLCSALCLTALTPQADGIGGLLKSSDVPSCPDFPWMLAEKWAKLVHSKVQLWCNNIPGKCSQALQFPCNPAGKQQPLRMPPSTLESPPCTGFKAGLTPFYSNSFFLFAYAYNHLLFISSLAFPYFFPYFCVGLFGLV